MIQYKRIYNIEEPEFFGKIPVTIEVTKITPNRTELIKGWTVKNHKTDIVLNSRHIGDKLIRTVIVE